MGLLDVPPEILERIIRFYVNEVGIDRAWSRRNVCRTFKSFIQYEIHAKQPMETLATAGIFSSALRRPMYRSEYLRYRMKSLNGAIPCIPSKLKAIHADLMENTTKKDSRHLQEQYAMKLCHVTATLWDWRILSCHWDSCPHLETDEVIDADKIAAAASIGDEQLLRKLILDHPMDAADQSDVLAFPLEAAVAGGQAASAKILLDHLATLDDAHEREILDYAITAMGSNESHSLVEAFSESFSRNHENDYIFLLESSWNRAVSRCDYGLIKILYNHLPQFQSSSLERPRSRFDYWMMVELFRDLCRHGFRDIAKGFIDKGYIHSLTDCAMDCPLLSAIQHDQADLIPLLLDKGFPVDNFWGRHPLWPKPDSPLKFAIRIRATAAVKILIEQGAKTNIKLNYWFRKTAKDPQTGESKQAEADIRELFKSARAAQSARRGTRAAPIIRRNPQRKAKKQH